MAAYLVFTRKRTVDAQELAKYWQNIRSTFVGHPIEVLAAYGPHMSLEGPPIEGAVIARFPTLDAARAWYDSPAYQKVAAYRLRGAEYDGFIVTGVAADSTSGEVTQ
jgi:uncharacterized protein (DUF1330 family)